MPRSLTIGRVADATGCKVQTIRYYEQIGLLSAPDRTHGNHRIYDAEAIDRLSFIRHARALGFPLEAIRDLLTVSESPGGSCAEADSIVRDQLGTVEQRLVQLTALRDELRRMLQQCAGGKIKDCRVIQSLADHTLCQTDHGDRPPI